VKAYRPKKLDLLKKNS